MSALRDALREYVAVRRALGTQLRVLAVSLGHFVDLLERERAEFITTEIALRWASESEHVEQVTRAQRLSAVRRFARWLSAFDPRTEVPPRGLIEARYRRPKPHIFTDQEISQLMAEAARQPSSTGLEALTQVTLIGLLAATGLRPGEALALDAADVDLQSGVLAIRKTKFGKSRFVPVEDSTRVALVRYQGRRDERCQQRTGAFLVSEQGTRLHGPAVRRAFAKVCRAIGLRTSGGQRRGRVPRLQDFRHTFATRRLVEWYRAGLDVEREMPKLSTYLGHVSVGNTYWYIESVPELLQLATERLTAGPHGGTR